MTFLLDSLSLPIRQWQYFFSTLNKVRIRAGCVINGFPVIYRTCPRTRSRLNVPFFLQTFPHEAADVFRFVAQGVINHRLHPLTAVFQDETCYKLR